jgi:hypothetical protein
MWKREELNRVFGRRASVDTKRILDLDLLACRFGMGDMTLDEGDKALAKIPGSIDGIGIGRSIVSERLKDQNTTGRLMVKVN